MIEPGAGTSEPGRQGPLHDARSFDRYALCGLAAAVFVCFSTFTRADLFWDDHAVVRSNGPIALWRTLWDTWFGNCVLFENVEYAFYRPLIDISFVLNYQLGGTHPLVYVATNFALHLANTLLLYVLVRRLLPTQVPPWHAVLAAVVFGLHPLQAESALWAAARPAVLGQTFVFIAAHSAITAAHATNARSRVAWGAGSIVAFVCALLSKEVSLTWAFAAPIALVAASRRRDLMALCAAFVAVAVAYLLLNRAGGPGLSSLIALGPVEALRILSEFIGFYARALVWPLNLAPHYVPGTQGEGGTAIIGAVCTGLCLVAAVAAVVKPAWPRPVVAVGLAQAGASLLLPHLAGMQYPADRYAYQALAGLALAAAALGSLMRWHRFAVVEGAILALILSGLTIRQSAFWIAEDVTWQRVLDVDPRNAKPNLFFGLKARREGDLELALQHFQVAARDDRYPRDRDRFSAAMSLGEILAASGDLRAADEAYALAGEWPAFRDDTLLRRAVLALRAGDHTRARQLRDQVNPIAITAPHMLRDAETLKSLGP